MRLAVDRLDVRVVRERDANGLIGRCGQGRKRRRRSKIPRLVADDAAIFLLAARFLADGGGEIGAAKLEASLRLGNVGLGDVADLEAVVGRFEVSLKHLNIVPVQFDDRPVADNVHVSGDRLREDVALDPAEGRPAGLDSSLGRLDRVVDPAAGEQRHAEIHSDRERRPLASGVQDSTSCEVLVEPRGCADLRTALRAGDGDSGVGRFQRLPLSG